MTLEIVDLSEKHDILPSEFTIACKVLQAVAFVLICQASLEFFHSVELATRGICRLSSCRLGNDSV